jgi:hypothetical protein
MFRIRNLRLETLEHRDAPASLVGTADLIRPHHHMQVQRPVPPLSMLDCCRKAAAAISENPYLIESVSGKIDIAALDYIMAERALGYVAHDASQFSPFTGQIQN